LCKNEEKEHETNLEIEKFILSKLCEACDQSFLGLGRGGRGENPAGSAVGGGGNLCGL